MYAQSHVFCVTNATFDSKAKINSAIFIVQMPAIVTMVSIVRRKLTITIRFIYAHSPSHEMRAKLIRPEIWRVCKVDFRNYSHKMYLPHMVLCSSLPLAFDAVSVRHL